MRSPGRTHPSTSMEGSRNGQVWATCACRCRNVSVTWLEDYYNMDFTDVYRCECSRGNRALLWRSKRSVLSAFLLTICLETLSGVLSEPQGKPLDRRRETPKKHGGGHEAERSSFLEYHCKGYKKKMEMEWVRQRMLKIHNHWKWEAEASCEMWRTVQKSDHITSRTRSLAHTQTCLNVGGQQERYTHTATHPQSYRNTPGGRGKDGGGGGGDWSTAHSSLPPLLFTPLPALQVLISI